MRVVFAGLIFSVLLALAGRPLPAQGYDERLELVDILHYTFLLELNDSTDHIRGVADLKVRYKQAADGLSLDLVASGKGSGKPGMTVLSVEEDQSAVSFRHQEALLDIQPGSPVKAGDERFYRITYQGVPADGLVIGLNKFGDRTFFGDNWPNRAHHWLPTIDHPSDKATVEFIVIAPEHYQVIANGWQREETNLDGGRKLTHWQEDVPLPTKVMVIGAAPFAVQQLGPAGGVPLSSWVFPGNREEGFYDYALAGKVLEWFVDSLGAFPYEKLANVQSKTRYGGMENAGNIFYYENSVSGKRTIEALLAHEIAHQWFGNSASEASWYHVWLSEGFATYFTDLYMEAIYGPERLAQRMEDERRQVLAYAKNRRAPVVDPSVRNINRLLNANSYQKGAWVLHMLRRQVGDAAFWRGVRMYYDRYRYSNALTSDFQQVMEDVSGQDLGWFFRQWIFTSGHPELTIEWTYDQQKKEVVLQVEQKQPEGPFRFFLDLRAVDQDGGQLGSATIELQRAAESFRLPVSSPPAALEIDPAVRLLFSGTIRKR